MAALATITPIHQGAAPAAPPSLTLYDIENEVQALVDTAELVPADREAQFLEELKDAMVFAVDKRDRVAQFLAHLEVQ